MKRSPALAARRVGQTIRLYRNFPAVFVALARGRSAGEICFELRNGLTITSPNVAGARFPIFEIFGDDAYDIDLLLQDLPAEPVALDLGGQIGAFTLAVTRAHPGLTVHTYEASPTTAGYASRNVAANRLADRVTVHAMAVSGESGEFTMLDTGTASAHNGLTSKEDQAFEVTVPAVTFDEAVAAAGGRVDLIKADIEGAEYDAFFKSSPASWSSVKKVVLEYHPHEHYGLSDLVAFLGGHQLTMVRHVPMSETVGSAWFSRSRE